MNNELIFIYHKKIYVKNKERRILVLFVIVHFGVGSVVFTDAGDLILTLFGPQCVDGIQVGGPVGG